MGKNTKECTAACVKGGAKYVFVSKGKADAIQNQDFGTLAANAGAKFNCQETWGRMERPSR